MSEEIKKAGSPVLGQRFMKELAVAGDEAFSAEGAVHKTGFLTLLVIVGACFAWTQADQLGGIFLPVLLLNLVLGLAICFVPVLAPGLSPIYAIMEGLLLGLISVRYERLYQGLVFQAAAGTLGVLVVMVAGYSSGLLKLGERGKAIVSACTLGLCLSYLFSLIAGFFGYHAGFIYDASPLAIGFSIFALIIAALNLSLDFEFIENAQAAGLAKRMEWYAAFGVLVTLVWIYLEMLRLLSKLRRR